MASGARLRFLVEIPVERVEVTLDAEGWRAKLAVEAVDDLPALVAEVQLSREVYDEIPEEERAATLDALCTEAAVREIRRAVGEAMRTRRDGPDTLRDLMTGPRIDHAERAQILATLVREKREEMERNCGPDWIETMLISEFRAVYTDGEQKGAKLRAETIDNARIGEWYRQWLAPRLVNAPVVGGHFIGTRITLCEERPNGVLVPLERGTLRGIG